MQQKRSVEELTSFKTGDEEEFQLNSTLPLVFFQKCRHCILCPPPNSFSLPDSRRGNCLQAITAYVAVALPLRSGGSPYRSAYIRPFARPFRFGGRPTAPFRRVSSSSLLSSLRKRTAHNPIAKSDNRRPTQDTATVHRHHHHKHHYNCHEHYPLGVFRLELKRYCTVRKFFLRYLSVCCPLLFRIWLNPPLEHFRHKIVKIGNYSIGPRIPPGRAMRQ